MWMECEQRREHDTPGAIAKIVRVCIVYGAGDDEGWVISHVCMVVSTSIPMSCFVLLFLHFHTRTFYLRRSTRSMFRSFSKTKSEICLHKSTPESPRTTANSSASLRTTPQRRITLAFSHHCAWSHSRDRIKVV